MAGDNKTIFELLGVEPLVTWKNDIKFDYYEYRLNQIDESRRNFYLNIIKNTDGFYKSLLDNFVNADKW